ncbi:UvrD-helicase domain-containing protein [Candidatus Microgenomates bacterium]|nr:UvrD-helicase domain-containing protein [Candidatus Microgenomates bacterium]
MNSDILANLNPPQQEAVTFRESPLLILAGAGSGKTRALTHRAAWLIKEKGIDPQNMLCLTFTNKAAGEMKERINKLLTSHITPNSSPITIPWAGTFHSFCAKVLRASGHHIDLPISFAIYDENDQLETVKEIMKKLSVATIKPHSALNAIEGAKQELIDSSQYQKLAYGPWQKKIAIIYLEYQKLLTQASACDFEDLLFNTITLFEKHPAILNEYQNRYSCILVDEWQDTNTAQYHLIKLLAQKNRHLTVVGDAAQSIYSWRGANFRNVENLSRDFPELTVINLEQNYRSTQTILDAAFHVISQNRSHPILKLWTEKGQGQPVLLYQSRDEMDEAAYVVNKINYLARTQSKTYNDFAVLYRTNSQSRVIEEAFLHASIPYIVVGGVRFYERKEVKDVISYLRLLMNEKDTVSFKRVEKLGKNRLKKFMDNLATGKSDEKSSTLELMDKILEVTGYLELYDPNDTEDTARLENIKELRSVAAEFSAPVEFLEQIALVENTRRAVVDHQAVTLMTAHAAKGLEFEVVIIVGMEEGLFPHSRSLENEEELEEERRLCYVGMTRAKSQLILTFSTRRLLFGQRASNLPSRFLADIPQNLTEIATEGIGSLTALTSLSWLEQLKKYD